MKQYVPLLLLLLSGLLPAGKASAQSQPDSLYTAIQAMPADSAKAILLIETAISMAKSAPPQALRYAEEALSLSETINFLAGKARAHYAIGFIALNSGQMEDALENFSISLRICNQSPALLKQKGDALRGLGVYFQHSGDKEAAWKYASQSLAVARETKDSLAIAKGLNNLGTMSSGADRLSYYFQALEILEVLVARPSGPGLAHNSLVLTYNNISGQYLAQNNLEEAIRYLEKAIELNDKINNLFNKMSFNIMFVTIYQRKGDLHKALDNGLQALNIARTLGKEGIEIATLNDIIGKIYVELKLFPSALKHLEEACRLFKSLDNTPLLIPCMLSISDILRQTGESAKAFALANEALNLARLQELFPLMVTCETAIGEMYAALKDDPHALERFLRAIALIDQHNLPKAGFAELYKDMAECCTRLGQTRQAGAMMEEYNRLKPEPVRN